MIKNSDSQLITWNSDIQPIIWSQQMIRNLHIYYAIFFTFLIIIRNQMIIMISSGQLISTLNVSLFFIDKNIQI